MRQEEWGAQEPQHSLLTPVVGDWLTIHCIAAGAFKDALALREACCGYVIRGLGEGRCLTPQAVSSGHFVRVEDCPRRFRASIFASPSCLCSSCLPDLKSASGIRMLPICEPISCGMRRRILFIMSTLHSSPPHSIPPLRPALHRAQIAVRASSSHETRLSFAVTNADHQRTSHTRPTHVPHIPSSTVSLTQPMAWTISPSLPPALTHLGELLMASCGCARPSVPRDSFRLRGPATVYRACSRS